MIDFAPGNIRQAMPSPSPSATQLLQLFSTSSDLLCTIDLEGRFVHVNHSSRPILGYTPDEMIGRHVFAFVCEQDQVKTTAASRAVRRGQDQVHFENRYRHKMGHLVALQWSTHWDSAEGLVYCIARDVSKRLKEEEERTAYERLIKAKNDRLTGVLEHMKQGFIALDGALRVEHWNKKAVEITKVPAESAVGRPVQEVLPEDALRFYIPLCLRVLDTGESLHQELIGPLNNRWVEIDIYPSQSGISLFFKDIEERKRSEAELRKLSLIAKETENAVILIDPERRTTWVNPAFTRMTGYSMDEVLGKVPATLLEGPGTDPETKRHILKQYQKKVPFSVEILNYKKNGEPFWSEMHIQPLFDASGNVEQYFSLRKDITERKKLERELAEQRKKTTAAIIAAQEKERALVSRELHDSVNPVLTTVKLYQDLVLNDPENRLAFVAKSKELLQNSINEIRRLSKRLSVPALGFAKLAESIQELLDSVSATNRFALSYDVESIEDLTVSTDLHLGVYRILQEHLTNVLKYADAPAVDIVIRVVSGNLLLCVSDKGKGFDPRKKRNGIGIANMTMRAEGLNGTLKIHSAPGEGCTLTVSIPLGEPSTPT